MQLSLATTTENEVEAVGGIDLLVSGLYQA